MEPTWWGTQFPDQSAEDIEGILADFMGLHTYVRMENLPFDGIHHIDMHMKLLDEETILMAEYPEGVADGPQIEANLEYVLANHTSRWGTPFDVDPHPLSARARLGRRLPRRQRGLHDLHQLRLREQHHPAPHLLRGV